MLDFERADKAEKDKEKEEQAKYDMHRLDEKDGEDKNAGRELKEGYEKKDEEEEGNRRKEDKEETEANQQQQSG